ncbi:hypothetical protein [Streptomyces sp. NPDC048720]|uniref:hypothetical protein n=1 Tax=Streptomyces sp. NPDC048720 TaxID=3365588 RepID=UPI00371BD954
MSDFNTWLNGNWDKVVDITAPNSGTTLPQTGSYNLGDRFYKTDTKSIYILVCKDASWGWFWRPVHDAISPWITPPTTCMSIAGWTLNPVPADPFAIALDNRGQCYWRGVIGPVTGNIPRNNSQVVFKPVADGIRPRQSGGYMIGHDTLAVTGTDGSVLTAYQGARIYISDDPGAGASIRAFGGSADFNRVYLTGVSYAVGMSKYWSV